MKIKLKETPNYKIFTLTKSLWKSVAVIVYVCLIHTKSTNYCQITKHKNIYLIIFTHKNPVIEILALGIYNRSVSYQK